MVGLILSSALLFGFQSILTRKSTYRTHIMFSSQALSSNEDKASQQWDAERYKSQHSFVWEYGSTLIDLLEPKPGEFILDLGCGTGELAHEIQGKGARVIGIDADPQMIAKAKSQFSSVDYRVGDARSFSIDEQVDAIFSNAALHWIPEAERAVLSIVRALKPGGRLVIELGGKGNVESISSFLDRAVGRSRNPWYFPSISEYSNLLEKNGMEVTFAQLFDRPTQLSEGEYGLRNWIFMFGVSYLDGLTEEEKEHVVSGAEKELRQHLFQDGEWIADYRRIRLVARKL